MLRVFKPTAGPRWPATRPSKILSIRVHGLEQITVPRLHDHQSSSGTVHCNLDTLTVKVRASWESGVCMRRVTVTSPFTVKDTSPSVVCLLSPLSSYTSSVSSSPTSREPGPSTAAIAKTLYRRVPTCKGDSSDSSLSWNII